MGKSMKRVISEMPEHERTALIESLDIQTLEMMAREEWFYVQRPEQVPPPGDWTVHLYLAGRGCIAPWTRIYLPLEGRWEAVEKLAIEGSPVTVRALGASGPEDVATDGAPFLRGTAPYWQVTLDNGDKITVTDQHQFLTPQGWLRLADVHVGQLLAVSSLSPRREASPPSESPRGAQRCCRTLEDSPDGCLTCRDSHDQQLQLAKAAAQVRIPSPADADVHSQRPSGVDGRLPSGECSRQHQLSGHPSRSSYVAGEPSAPTGPDPTRPSVHGHILQTETLPASVGPRPRRVTPTFFSLR